MGKLLDLGKGSIELFSVGKPLQQFFALFPRGIINLVIYSLSLINRVDNPASPENFQTAENTPRDASASIIDPSCVRLPPNNTVSRIQTATRRCARRLQYCPESRLLDKLKMATTEAAARRRRMGVRSPYCITRPARRNLAGIHIVRKTRRRSEHDTPIPLSALSKFLSPVFRRKRSSLAHSDIGLL